MGHQLQHGRIIMEGKLELWIFLQMKLAGVCVLDEVWIMFAVNKMLLVARFS